jgi:hypothetical protein
MTINEIVSVSIYLAPNPPQYQYAWVLFSEKQAETTFREIRPDSGVMFVCVDIPRSAMVTSFWMAKQFFDKEGDWKE